MYKKLTLIFGLGMLNFSVYSKTQHSYYPYKNNFDPLAHNAMSNYMQTARKIKVASSTNLGIPTFRLTDQPLNIFGRFMYYSCSYADFLDPGSHVNCTHRDIFLPKSILMELGKLRAGEMLSTDMSQKLISIWLSFINDYNDQVNEEDMIVKAGSLSLNPPANKPSMKVSLSNDGKVVDGISGLFFGNNQIAKAKYVPSLYNPVADADHNKIDIYGIAENKWGTVDDAMPHNRLKTLSASTKTFDFDFLSGVSDYMTRNQIGHTITRSEIPYSTDNKAGLYADLEYYVKQNGSRMDMRKPYALLSLKKGSTFFYPQNISLNGWHRNKNNLTWNVHMKFYSNYQDAVSDVKNFESQGSLGAGVFLCQVPKSHSPLILKDNGKYILPWDGNESANAEFRFSSQLGKLHKYNNNYYLSSIFDLSKWFEIMVKEHDRDFYSLRTDQKITRYDFANNVYSDCSDDVGGVIDDPSDPGNGGPIIIDSDSSTDTDSVITQSSRSSESSISVSNSSRSDSERSDKKSSKKSNNSNSSKGKRSSVNSSNHASSKSSGSSKKKKSHNGKSETSSKKSLDSGSNKSSKYNSSKHSSSYQDYKTNSAPKANINLQNINMPEPASSFERRSVDIKPIEITPIKIEMPTINRVPIRKPVEIKPIKIERPKVEHKKITPIRIQPINIRNFRRY